MIDLTADSATFVGDFAEAVIYRPKGGTPRTIQAIVDYLDPESLSETERGLGPAWQVTVANDAVTGIDAAELNTKADEVTLPARVGRSAVTARIMAVVTQDQGLLQVKVR